MERFPAELGRFRIEGELGRGGMGVVYRAFDPVVERSVAIKTIHCADGFNRQLLERLRREAKAVGSLEHPNIVTLFDAGDAEGMFYLVMQLVEGETLRQRMDRQPQFRAAEILDVFRQLLAALEYAHARGIVHRDVKPANVLITPEGTVKLTDFGVARLGGPAVSTKGLVIGTPCYMAPEQILGTPVDGRSDMFAAGCILYELVTGRRAFTGSSTTAVMYQVVHEPPAMPSSVVPGLRPATEAAILKSLAKNPDERFGSCAEFRSALEFCLTEELPQPIKAKKAPGRCLEFAIRVAGVIRKGGAWAAVAAGILVTVALVSHALVVAPRQTDPRPEPIPQAQIPSVPPPQLPLPAMPDPAPVTPLRRPRVQESRRATPAPVPVVPSIPKRVVAPAEPDSFTSWMVRGDVEFQRERYREALEDYKRALQLKPADGTIRRKVAVTLTLLGQPEGARTYQR
jgi:hypothetical protein